MAGKKALSLPIKDTQTLLSAYMPMLERGGLFIPTKERYALGQEIFLLLTLPGENERLPVRGNVVWISPPGIGGRRRQGVGIHFGDDDQAVRDRIEDLLGEQLNGDTPTYTF